MSTGERAPSNSSAPVSLKRDRPTDLICMDDDERKCVKLEEDPRIEVFYTGCTPVPEGVFLQRGVAPTVLQTRPFRFYSGAADSADSSFVFSNLFASPTEFEGRLFPSAEHAYQASKFPSAVRWRFAEGGDLADFTGLSFFYPATADVPQKDKNTASGKQRYWQKKSMVGIVAKLCQKHYSKAGLPSPTASLSMAVKLARFRTILMNKFSVDPVLRGRLLATGDRYLLEFCRGARHRERNAGTEPERWGGLDAEQADGSFRLYGDNSMGKLLMVVRRACRIKEA
jgi:predicted NAD-dependent protein-ADP-ribosyltransferase YbiA (DUF1768 family)